MGFVENFYWICCNIVKYFVQYCHHFLPFIIFFRQFYPIHEFAGGVSANLQNFNEDKAVNGELTNDESQKKLNSIIVLGYTNANRWMILMGFRFIAMNF